MKRSLIILTFLTSCTVARVGYTPIASIASRSVVAVVDSAKFFTGDESAVEMYLIEFATDTVHYKAIGKIYPGKSAYSFPIDDQYNGFIRIHSVGDSDFYKGPIMHNTNNVTITGATYSTTLLKWTVTGERNVMSYLIEKSSDGKTWSKTTQIPDRGNGTYNYRYSKTKVKYQYRITAVYIDQTKATTSISFK